MFFKITLYEKHYQGYLVFKSLLGSCKWIQSLSRYDSPFPPTLIMYLRSPPPSPSPHSEQGNRLNPDTGPLLSPCFSD